MKRLTDAELKEMYEAIRALLAHVEGLEEKAELSKAIVGALETHLKESVKIVDDLEHRNATLREQAEKFEKILRGEDCGLTGAYLDGYNKGRKYTKALLAQALAALEAVAYKLEHRANNKKVSYYETVWVCGACGNLKGECSPDCIVGNAINALKEAGDVEESNQLYKAAEG